MLARLEHRGRLAERIRRPDASLGVCDPAGPNRWPPRGSEDPSEICAVLDGRIDNAADLAAELAREGHACPGANPAAVVAIGMRAHGIPFLQRLQGLFAAAVHDPARNVSWLIRDPLGMRPVYLHRTRSRILFASEIGALFADPVVRSDVDPSQLRVLLTLGFMPSPLTLLKGIHKMPPGHLLEVSGASLRVISYAKKGPGEDLELPYEDALEAYRATLHRVVRRSAGEETVGVLLSGGADSSALVLLRTREGRPVASFTAGFQDAGEEDERVEAWQAARALGTLHRETTIRAVEIPSLLSSVARTIDEPVAAPWMAPFYRLAASIEGQTPVVWSGQGTGSLHGESPVWRWRQWGEWVSELPPFVAGVVGGVSRTLGRLDRAAATRNHRMVASREERERVLSAFFLFEDAELDRLLRAGHIGDREAARKLLDRWREPVADRDPLDQSLYIYARTHLPDGVLLPAERLASEHGLFLRFPYADPEVVQWLERLPASYRLQGGAGKRLHRDALAAWLPAGVLARPKRQLGDLTRLWLRTGGREQVSQWLLGSAAWLPSVLDGVRVRGLLEEASRGRIERIVLLIHLELWMREMLQGGGR
ncbi:MAG: asparagine synthase-related protein [Candidatus Eisenbacteria bacterium]|nr:asparagine synthase-related protein [Candidatus Eisenbacteria bacterium]